MTGSTNIEYCLVQYVPNVVRDERISIAAIFIDSSDLQNGFCTVSFAQDWQNKVHLFDPDSDLEMLRALLAEIRGRLLSTSERSDMIRQLEDSFSIAFKYPKGGNVQSRPDRRLSGLSLANCWAKASNPSLSPSGMKAPTFEAKQVDRN
jgi:Protein of unknown function (DUF3037)